MQAIGEPFVDARLDEALEGRAVDAAQDGRVFGVVGYGVDVRGVGGLVVVGSDAADAALGEAIRLNGGSKGKQQLCPGDLPLGWNWKLSS